MEIQGVDFSSRVPIVEPQVTAADPLSSQAELDLSIVVTEGIPPLSDPPPLDQWVVPEDLDPTLAELPESVRRSTTGYVAKPWPTAADPSLVVGTDTLPAK